MYSILEREVVNMSPFGDQYFSVYVNLTQTLFKYHSVSFKFFFTAQITAVNNIEKVKYCCIMFYNLIKQN